MQTGNKDFKNENELDKGCFQHDMAYDEPKYLAKRTQSEKGLRDQAFKIASDPKYDGYQRGLTSMGYKFFDKKSSGSGDDTEPNINLQLNFISRSLENSRDEKFIRLLGTIFGVLI